MQKLLILFTFCLLFTSQLAAQFIPFENFQFSWNQETKSDRPKLPFKNVQVVDKRFDTTKFGYAVWGQRYKNVQLKKPLTTSIENYFRNNVLFTPGSNKILVIVLKTLWMHEMKSGEENQEDLNNEKQNISKYILKADLYSAENGNYQALIRTDTIFSDPRPLREVVIPFLSTSLDYIGCKLASVNLDQMFLKKNKISENDVMNYYELRFKKPRILHDTLQRGIYLTFKDFLYNQPSAYTFSLEQDEKSDYLYIEENGQEKLFTDFWGFSDGDHLYIRLGVNFFKLTRNNNTYFFGDVSRQSIELPVVAKTGLFVI